MIRNQIKRYLCAVACGAVIASTLVGCASSTSKVSNSTPDKKAEPTKISVMTMLMGAQPPRTEGNPILKKMEEFTNTTLDISYVPSGSYKDKLNVTIASNSLPMVTVVDGGTIQSTSIVNSETNGMFWEVGSLLNNYPNLKKFYSNPLVLSNCSIDGKLYGLPRPRVLGRSGLIIRQDWLDNLGIKAPTTPEEVYDVAKAFTLNDPDKDGKADTVGLEYADISVGSYGWNGITTMTVALGGFNTWGVQDGKVAPDFATKPYMQSLGILQKIYKDKYMNQDFALATGTKRYDAFDSGNCGMIFATIDDAGGNAQNSVDGARQTLMKTVSTAKLSIVPALSGPNGQKVPATSGHNGMVMFSKSSVKTEADLKNILSYFDKMTSAEMTDLFTYGIEGVNYTVDNGVKKSIENSKFLEDSTEMTQFVPRPATIETPTDKSLTKAINATFKANEKFLVPNVAESLTSDTKNQVGGQLDKLIADARVKYVMGQLDDAGFAKVVDTWRQQGGDKVIQELTAANSKVKK